jgi:hypothetical protein
MKTESIIAEQLTTLGFTLVLTGGARGEVRDNDWPCIAYSVRLEYKGRFVIETDYRLGVGHVKVPTRWEDQPEGLTLDETFAFNTLRNKPSAQLNDKALHASFAAKLAKAQKVVPQLADVMHSLVRDGEAFFDATTFEDWAANMGYDADSRKAEAIYKACDDIGRKLARGIPSEVLTKVREIVSEL